MSDGLERTQAFYDILADRKIPIRNRWVFDYHHKPHVDLATYIEGTVKNLPTAFLAFNDIAALHIPCNGS